MLMDERITIQSKLLLLSFILISLPLLVVGFFSFKSARTALVEKIGWGEANIALASMKQIDRFLNERLIDLHTWSVLGVMEEIQSKDADGKISETLSRLKERNSNFDEIHVLNPEGLVIGSSRIDAIGQQMGKDDWFQKAISEETLIKDTHTLNRSGQRSVLISSIIRPVNDQSQDSRVSDAQGIIVSLINWNKIRERIALEHSTEFGGTQKQYILLLDQYGEVISGPDWLETPDIDINDFTNLKSFSAAKKEESGFLIEEFFNQDYLIGYAASAGYDLYKSLGWTTYIFQSVDQAFIPIEKMKKQSYMIGFALLFCLGILSLMFARNIALPMKTFSEVTMKITNGDLTKKVVVNSKDELGELAKSFNIMIWSIQSLMKGIRSAGYEIDSSATEINQGASQQAAGAAEQSSTVTEVSTTVEELSQTAGRIAENAQNLTKSAEETLKGMAGVKSNVDHVAKKILALGEKSQSIGNITKLIDELSDRINLLALNAAIEAARAGEAGRGFAVVAAEVGKLAERSAESTSDIRQLIGEIQSEMNSTIMGVEETTKWTDKGLEMVGDTARVIKEISIATQQQKSAAEQVVDAMVSIDKVTTTFASTTKLTALSARKLSTLSAQLKDDVSSFKLDEEENDIDENS